MRRPNGAQVHIQEVSPRDGCQIESRFIPTERRMAIVNRLSRTGIGRIEVTSFSSPRAIVALADAEAVMRAINRLSGVMYAVLMPIVSGCERALVCAVDEINLLMSAAETHNLVNLRITCDESLRQCAEIASICRAAGVSVNAWLSTATPRSLRVRDPSGQRGLEQPGPRHFLSAHRGGLHGGNTSSSS